ncbi:MAG: hypothetical protein U0229_07345 [Anaeromyxobacter sp.]
MAVRAATVRPSPFAHAMHQLASLREPACLLDADGVVLFVNEAWDRFASVNGGGTHAGSAGLVGTRWLDGIQGEDPRRVHAVLLHRAMRREGNGPGGAVIHTSEANDGVTARLVATRLEAILSPAGALVAVAVVHRTVRELPLAEVYPPLDADGDAYRCPGGGIEQCTCCRRTVRPDGSGEWDYVLSLAAVPPRSTRFVYCPLCLELHCPTGPGIDGPDGIRGRGGLHDA